MRPNEITPRVQLVEMKPHNMPNTSKDRHTCPVRQNENTTRAFRRNENTHVEYVEMEALMSEMLQ